MKISSLLSAFRTGGRQGPGGQFPNLNLLPRELARPIVSRLSVIMIVLLLVELGGGGMFRVKATTLEKDLAASQGQLTVMNRRLSEASTIRQDAGKIRGQIATLEESPKLYLQLAGHYDKSAILQTLLDNTPAGVILVSIQGRGDSLTLQARAYPSVALEYYQTLRKLPAFSSVILRFVSAPDAARPAEFSVEIVIRGPQR